MMYKRATMAEEHKMTIRIPVDLHWQAKAKAALQGVALSAVVRDFLEQWIEEDPPEPEKKGKKP